VSELFRIFVDVLTPVFFIVGVGYLAAGRMKVDAGTLSKLAYWILGPAFIFDVLAGTDLQGDVVLRVVLVSLATMIVTGLVAILIARAMGRSRSETSATMLTSAHGNVGNFGIAIAAFAFGDQALPLAGIVMVTVNTAGILVGVAAATSRASGPAVAIRTAFLAPMALAVIPAVLVNVSDTTLPVFADRPIGLLANALIPMMLLTLGIQLGQMDRPHIGSIVAVPITAKLIVAPAVAASIVAIVGPAGLAGQVVIVQAAMPAAVFTSLVALEHDMEPDLVTTIVLAGTLVSVVTLPVVLTLV
jgi:predicted permease